MCSALFCLYLIFVYVSIQDFFAWNDLKQYFLKAKTAVSNDKYEEKIAYIAATKMSNLPQTNSQTFFIFSKLKANANICSQPWA